jgi:hypothetical protein
MIIHLTITLKKRVGTATAIGIAEGAAAHLMGTFNDDGSLKKIEYAVLNAQKHDAGERVSIVHRDSADGPEVDVFTDDALAQEWAEHIGSTVTEECIIDRTTLNAMKKSYEEEES